MNTRVYGFQTQKAFWITQDGFRKYCRASVDKLSSRFIELSATNMFQSGFRTELHSADGFCYEGRMHINGREYGISIRAFAQGWDLVLYGSWAADDNSRGEIIIQGVIRGLVLQETGNTTVPEKLNPAA